MKGLYLIKQLKQLIIDSAPKPDRRTNIDPKSLAICAIVSLSGDNKSFSLESIRRELMLMTGKEISRSAFWERLTTNRLFGMLVKIFSKISNMLPTHSISSDKILKKLEVEGISLFDASTVTLPDDAKKSFPGAFTESGLKLHLEMDANTGRFNWAALTSASVHDRTCLPDLESLVGRLSIFDLGYYDWGYYNDLNDTGGYFLSRAKVNCSLTIDEIVKGLGHQHTGKNLNSIKFKRKRAGIIEFKSIKEVDGDDFTFRVIGFWNSREKQYHWYITNLSCNAKLIYPLYRFRWQIELMFKSAKGSLNMDQIPTSDRMIILNIFLARMIAVLIAMVIREIGTRNSPHSDINYISLQRSARVFVLLRKELMNYLYKSKRSNAWHSFRKSLKLMLRELFDPNQGNRKSSKAELDDLCMVC